MKFRRVLISLSIATALLALSISDVKACTCSFVGPPCEEYWRPQAVFAGKVIKKSTFYVEEGEGDSRHKYQQVLARCLREGEKVDHAAEFRKKISGNISRQHQGHRRGQWKEVRNNDERRRILSSDWIGAGAIQCQLTLSKPGFCEHMRPK